MKMLSMLYVLIIIFSIFTNPNKIIAQHINNQLKSITTHNLDVPFLSQVPPGNWIETRNCGQTSCLMVFCYYWEITPTPQGIKDIDDWLFRNYGVSQSVRNYNGEYTTTTILEFLSKNYAVFPNTIKFSGWTLGNIENELNSGYPVIVAVHIDMNPANAGHFMVIRGIDENYIYVNDPGHSLESGKGKNYRYTRSTFEASWIRQNKSGIVIRSNRKKTDEIIVKGSTPEIYFLKNNILHQILDWSIYEKLRDFGYGGYQNLSDNDLINYFKGSKILSSGLICQRQTDYNDNGPIYLIQDNKKRRFYDEPAYTLRKYILSGGDPISPTVVRVPDILLDNVIEGALITTSYITVSGNLYFKKNGQQTNSFSPGDIKESYFVLNSGDGYTVYNYLRITFPDGTKKFACYPDGNTNVNFILVDEKVPLNLNNNIGIPFDICSQHWNNPWKFNTYTFSNSTAEGRYTWEFWYEDVNKPGIELFKDTESYTFSKPVNLPDLYITRVNGPASANPGAPININVTVNKTGGTLNPQYAKVKVFLSTDNIINENDLIIGESTDNQFLSTYLNSNGSRTESISCNIPVNINSRSYYIGAIVDPPSVSFHQESNENNNSYSGNTIQIINAPYEPNNSLTQAYGPLNKNQWYTAYIEMSTDIDWYKIVVTGGQIANIASVDLSDETIQKLNQYPVSKEESIISLKVGSDTLARTMSNLASNLTVDLDVPEGKDYELYLFSASGNIVGSSTRGTSSDERVTISASDGSFYIKVYGYSNAYSTSSAYRVKADWLSTASKINLTIYAGTSYNYFNPVSVSPGGTFTNYLRIKNTESSASGEFWVYTYLSNDATIGTSDTKVGELRVSPLNGNTYRDMSMACSVPASFSGNYYVGLIIDVTGLVSETNENDNNWYHSSLLSVSNDTYEPNNTMAQAYGPLNKNQWYTSYISNSTDIDWYKVTVTGGQTTNMTPVDLSDEIIQQLNQYPADKEEHNISFKVGADTLTKTMSNLASNLTVDLDVPEGKDYELFLYDASGITKGSSTAGTSSDERITVSVSNGTFYIKVYGYNNAYSTSSSYKVKAFDIPDIPKINLTLYSNSSYNYFNPASVNAGGQFTNYARIQNTESGNAGSFVVCTYISTNSTISVSDTKVGEYTFSSLNGNSYRDISMICTVPPAMSAGTYYVGVLIDVNGQVSESIENDNSWCFNSNLIIPPPSSGPYEPNDTITQAYGPLTKGLWYTAYIETSTDIDWYKVYVNGGMLTKMEPLDLSTEKLMKLNESPEEKEIFTRLLKSKNDSIQSIRANSAATTFTIDLDVPDGKDYELFVYDNSGVAIGSSTAGTSSDEKVSVSVVNGTFYIKVYGYSGAYSTTSSYRVKADWSSPPSGNVNLTVVSGQGYNHFEPKTVNIGGSFSNYLRIQNTESGTSGSFYVNTRISDNDFITEGDPVVGQLYVNSLSGYANQDIVITCTLPAGIQPGAYYVAFQIDPTNVIQETNESDNSFKYDASAGLLTVVPQQNILYSENFEDQIADGWTPKTPSRWSIVWDEGDYAYYINTSAYTAGEQSALTDSAFDNYTLSVSVKSPENLVQNPNANYTIAFNCVPGGYYYAMRFDGVNSQNTLFKSGYEIGSYNGKTIADNLYHQIRITKIGGSIKIYYDSTKVIDYFDYTPIPAGHITLGSYNDAVYFDDIIVTSEQSNKEHILAETAITNNPELTIPDKFNLLQNYPNPFNPETRITYSLPEQSGVTLIVFDVNGNEIRTLFEGNQAPGNYTFVWDAKDENGFTLPSGIYFYQLKLDKRIETKKMLLLK